MEGRAGYQGQSQLFVIQIRYLLFEIEKVHEHHFSIMSENLETIL